RQAMPFVHKIYITKVHHTFETDTFFPKIDAIDWQLIFKEDHSKDEKHQYDFSFHVLEKHL
ncbi:MAG: dihydrofolate reductase, partial [Pelobium sp.]